MSATAVSMVAFIAVAAAASATATVNSRSTDAAETLRVTLSQPTASLLAILHSRSAFFASS